MTEHGGPPRERRRHPRALTDLRATMNVRGASHAVQVINLSMGGALLDVGAGPPGAPLEKGELVSLLIRERGREHPLAADARVVLWNTTAADRPLLAVQFEPMTEEATEVLEELMAQAIAEIQRRLYMSRARAGAD
ncbi:MAG TPA: PilZ domain-containing protein [Polyangia bacterium]